jgi:hypothetical protein
MPKTFTRIISFEVEGELYDLSTTPEEFINSYDWRFKGFHDNHEDKCFLESSHDDSRGRITNMMKKFEIKKTEKPDTILADLFSV